MQIGHQFKLVKYQMEHVLQIIMDHQQENVFKMEQIVFGVLISLILAMVIFIHISYLILFIYFFFNK